MKLFTKEHYERNIVDYENNLKAFAEKKVIPKPGEVAANQKALEKEKQRLQALLEST